MKKLDGKRLAVIVGAVKAYSNSTPAVKQKATRVQGISPEGTSVGVAGNRYHVPLVKAPLNIWGIVGRQEIMFQQNMVQFHAYSRI